MRVSYTLLGLTSAVSLAAATFVDAAELQLMHFWTSGGEAAALDVVKQKAEAAGITWSDAAVAGGAGMNAFQVLQARVAAGDPPAAMQMHGAQIRQYAEAGLLLDVSDVAVANGWDKAIDPDLLGFAQYDGAWVGVPFNMHRPNWVWANKEILDAHGGRVPATWDEFFAFGDQLESEGIIPLATGGQPWQDLLLWELVLMGDQGVDFYRRTLVEQDPAAIDSPEMRAAFDTFRKVLSYTDTNRANRDWNLATAMVINGQAAMQIMGDWALGEFSKAGKTADVDYVCATSPGTEGVFMWNTDFWGFFRGLDEEAVAAQKQLAAITMDRDVQEQFNVLKGSSPARLDIGPDAFSPCGKKDIADRAAALEAGTVVPSFSQNSAVSTDVRGVYEDVVTQFTGNPDMTADEAVAAIVAGLATL